LGPISSVVLTFIGYKQTDRQAKFIYRLINSSLLCNLGHGFRRVNAKIKN